MINIVIRGRPPATNFYFIFYIIIIKEKVFKLGCCFKKYVFTQNIDFELLLLKCKTDCKYQTNDKFSFTITTRPHSILLSKTEKIDWFKGYGTLYVSKMVVTAILDFVEISYLTNLSKNTSPMLLSRQTWWQSVERLNSFTYE